MKQSRVPEWALLYPIAIVIPAVVTGHVIAGAISAALFGVAYYAIARHRRGTSWRRSHDASQKSANP